MDADKSEIDNLVTAYVEGEADDRLSVLQYIASILCCRPDLLDHGLSSIKQLFEADESRGFA